MIKPATDKCTQSPSLAGRPAIVDWLAYLQSWYHPRLSGVAARSAAAQRLSVSLDVLERYIASSIDPIDTAQWAFIGDGLYERSEEWLQNNHPEYGEHIIDRAEIIKIGQRQRVSEFRELPWFALYLEINTANVSDRVMRDMIGDTQLAFQFARDEAAEIKRRRSACKGRCEEKRQALEKKLRRLLTEGQMSEFDETWWFEVRPIFRRSLEFEFGQALGPAFQVVHCDLREEKLRALALLDLGKKRGGPKRAATRLGAAYQARNDFCRLTGRQTFPWKGAGKEFLGQIHALTGFPEPTHHVLRQMNKIKSFRS